MEKKTLRPLEFLYQEDIFDAVADMAVELGIPIATKNYDLKQSVTDEQFNGRGAKKEWFSKWAKA